MLWLYLTFLVTSLIDDNDEVAEAAMKERLKAVKGDQNNVMNQPKVGRGEMDEDKAKFREGRYYHSENKDGFGDDDDMMMDDDGEFYVQCLKPNTHKNAEGECQCDPGFVGVDPTFEGCWRCETPCHEKGTCVSGGACECLTGYLGDGVTDCEVIRPELIEAKPRMCKLPGCEITVSYKSKGGYVPHMGYCMFDNKMVGAESVTVNTMKCIVPDDARVFPRLSVAFIDGAFSAKVITLMVFRGFDFDDDEMLAAAMVAFVVIAFIVIIVRNKDNRAVRYVRPAALERGRHKGVPKWSRGVL